MVLSSLQHLLNIPFVILLIFIEYALFFACYRILIAWGLIQQLPLFLTRHNVALPLSVENISRLRDRPSFIWGVQVMVHQLILEQLDLTDPFFFEGVKCLSRLILLTVRKGGV